MRSKFLWTVAAAAMLAGCSGMPEKNGRDVDDHLRRAIELKGKLDTNSQASTVAVEEGLYIAATSVKLDARASLPKIFQEQAVFDRVVSSLPEFAARITLRSGIPTKVTPDGLAASLRTLQAGRAGSGGTTGAVSGTSSMDAPSPGLRTLQQQGRHEVHIAYPGGTLAGLLDAAAARFGVFWRYEDGAVSFFYTETRTFEIRAIPGDSSLTASVASSTENGQAGGAAASGGDGSSATGAQNTAVSSRLSVFGSIERSVASMLSPYGKVVASPATGSVSVTDSHDVLQRVASFIDDENKALGKQVMINVTVLAVTLNDVDNYGINWNLVYGDLKSRFGISNTFASAPGSTGFSAGILNTAASKFAGSTVMINALSTQGKVRRETSASVATLNNQPVPVQVARQTSFLKSSSTTITANVGTATSIEPGTVTAGFNMTILPHVLANGTVMLQFSTDISALRQIRRVSSGTATIETPELDKRNFLQRVAMKSGETLVVSGFEQTDSNVENQGVGKASFPLFGGGINASSSKEVIVILITPMAMGGA